MVERRTVSRKAPRSGARRKPWTWRVAFLSAAVVLATAIVATVGFFGEHRGCLATALAGRARLLSLEGELDARRAGLLAALERANTAEDIRDAARFLGSTPPDAGMTKGVTLGDLTYERDQLRTSVVVADPYGLRAKNEVAAPTDPWLLQNYPVDRFGYLYGASTNDLQTLRLAAREELVLFRADRVLPPASELEAVPNCSFLNTLRFALFGSEHFALRQRTN